MTYVPFAGPAEGYEAFASGYASSAVAASYSRAALGRGVEVAIAHPKWAKNYRFEWRMWSGTVLGKSHA